MSIAKQAAATAAYRWLLEQMPQERVVGSGSTVLHTVSNKAPNFFLPESNIFCAQRLDHFKPCQKLSVQISWAWQQ